MLTVPKTSKAPLKTRRMTVKPAPSGAGRRHSQPGDGRAEHPPCGRVLPLPPAAVLVRGYPCHQRSGFPHADPAGAGHRALCGRGARGPKRHHASRPDRSNQKLCPAQGNEFSDTVLPDFGQVIARGGLFGRSSLIHPGKLKKESAVMLAAERVSAAAEGGFFCVKTSSAV